MKKITIIIGTFLLLLSCNEKNSRVKEVYSEDGTLIKKYEYADPKDTSSYNLTEYYEDGNIKSIVPISEGKINGIVHAFFPNGELWLIRRYRNGKYHGVTYELNKKFGFLEREILYLNGEDVIIAQYGKATDRDNLFGVSYCYPIYSNSDTAFIPVGSISWDKEGKLVKKKCTYYETDAKDTVKMGEPYKINLRFYVGLYEDFSIELTLGDFDNDFNFIDSSKLTKYVGDSLSISFTYNDYEKGSNLLLGKIRLLENNKDITTALLKHPQVKEYLFYHQFDVIE